MRESGYQGRVCECGIVYTDPEPPPSEFDLAQDHHLDAYYALPARLRLEWISRFQPNGRLLEVGCGTGHFLAAAQARGYEVYGVEPNATAAREIAQTLAVDVEEAWIEESAQPKGTYDVVFHVDLLSHFPDPVRALRAMADLLRPGGVVCFEVGVFGGLSPGWYRWVGRIGYPQHRWLYSEEAIRTVLERADLQVEAVQRFGLLPATLLSTLGNAWVRKRVARPQGKEGRAAQTRGIYRLYSRLQYFLRYRLGAVIPPLGPYAMFIAARPRPPRAEGSPSN